MADYGPAHRNLRRAWKPRVAAGDVACARCGDPIDPDEPWDLGHDDDAPGEYNGPEHRDCNRSAGGTKRQAQRHQPDDTDRWAI